MVVQKLGAAIFRKMRNGWTVHAYPLVLPEGTAAGGRTDRGALNLNDCQEGPLDGANIAQVCARAQVGGLGIRG